MPIAQMAEYEDWTGPSFPRPGPSSIAGRWYFERENSSESKVLFNIIQNEMRKSPIGHRRICQMQTMRSILTEIAHFLGVMRLKVKKPSYQAATEPGIVPCASWTKPWSRQMMMGYYFCIRSRKKYETKRLQQSAEGSSTWFFSFLYFCLHILPLWHDDANNGHRADRWPHPLQCSAYFLLFFSCSFFFLFFRSKPSFWWILVVRSIEHECYYALLFSNVKHDATSCLK